MSFLNIINHQYQNSIIGVEWTISVEFVYYLILPTLFFISKKEKTILILLSIVGIFLYYNRQFHLPIYTYYAFDGTWGLERYLIVYTIAMGTFFLLFKTISVKVKKISYKNTLPIILFSLFALSILYYYMYYWDKLFLLPILGVAFYSKFIKSKLIKKWKNKILQHIFINIDLLCALLLVLVYISNSIGGAPEIFFALFSSLIIFTSFNGGILKKLLFENRIIIFIGEISFSFYLLHVIVITYTLQMLSLYISQKQLFILSFFITTILAYFMYRFIEKPFIQYAKKTLPLKGPLYFVNKKYQFKRYKKAPLYIWLLKMSKQRAR